MHVPTFDGDELARSSSYPFASSLRNSRVFAPRRTFTSISRYPLKEDRPREASDDSPPSPPPTMLVVSPNGQHGVLQYNWGVRVLEAGRDAALDRSHGDTVALDECYVTSGGVFTWRPERLDEGTRGGKAIARRLDAERYAAVVPAQPMEGVRYSPEIAIEGGRRHPRRAGDGLRSGTDVDGTGVAAIGADWTVVVALHDGTLRVFSPEADAMKNSLLIAKKQLGFRPAELSLVPPHIALFETLPTGVRLHLTDGKGEPLWSKEVPIAAGQPPVDGGGGRIYVVGNGIAALDGPEVAWVHPSSQPMHATAFADGSLALAVGSTLQMVTDTGTIVQTFETAEPLVTPPAIAADGQVWVASEKAVYVAQ